MANDGQIVFEVTADGKHAIADIKEITKAIQKETGKWDDAAEQATGSIENNFSGMLKKLVAGFSAAKIGKALLDIGKEAVSAASDLREVQNVVDVTFGNGAKQIETWSKSAGAQFGLTETQAKRFASTLGAMMKSSGLAGEEIVGMSTDLAGLAADMASFYNLDFDTAFQKIRSGISGETEPLKQLGINMSVANLNAFALQQGLSKTFEQMTQGEQTMLRYQYLMSATADAQGDFARTSDEYANGMRQLETNLTSIKTKLGNVLLDVVNPLVEGINALFTDSGKSRTVLDDFAGIDKETEAELAKITKTAEDARDLTKILDEIITEDKGKAFENLATGANKLNGSSVANWNSILGALTSINGLENLFGTETNADQNITDLANALSGSSVDTTKAEAWKTFLGALSENADAVSKLTGTSVEETKEWLETLGAAAGSLKEEDAEAWNTLLSAFVSGIDFNTPAGQQFRESLAQQFLLMGADSEEAAAGLQALGYSTDDISGKQREWLETCKRLVATIPGLSEIINTETGEVKGGVQAISDYVDEWEKAQKRMVYIKDIQKRQEALDKEFEDFTSLELDVKSYENKIKKQKEKIQDLYEKYGYSRDKPIGKLSPRQKGASEINAEIDVLSNLQIKYVGMQDRYENRKEAYDVAVQELEDVKEAAEELVGSLDDATEAEVGWSQQTKAAATEAVNAANEALQALADYAQGVHDSISTAIDSTTKGFAFIGDAAQRQSKRLEPLNAELEKLTEEGEDLSDINERISDAKDMFGIGNMRKNLESQLAFLREYKADMEAARARGFSDEFLAQFADGSVESAEWLHELAGASDGQVTELNTLYAQVESGKRELTDTLTQQQLSVDETYKTLAEKAKEAVAALDLEQEAADNAGKTVEGIATGIKEHVDSVAEQVDAILAQLNRLDGFGINIDLGGFGSISWTTSTGKNADGSGRFGIGYVPRDDYLIRAHEGERLLTAQENQIWNTLLNGGVAGFDLEDLGGVMRDNIKAGGNVYLDGKAVGAVVSDRQGRSYKSLQRSGWQQ